MTRQFRQQQRQEWALSTVPGAAPLVASGVALALAEQIAADGEAVTRAALRDELNERLLDLCEGTRSPDQAVLYTTLVAHLDEAVALLCAHRIVVG